MLPKEFEIKTLRIALDLNLDPFIAQKERIMKLNELDDYK